METKDFSALSEQLLSHITGGADEKKEFTCVYDTKKKKQESWYDDPAQEYKPVRPIE
ncbi:hypothetical protein [uncultured Porphyromonas sp.]|jgi:hypothetical protein|uniref:hypothetical protein n=1 Tax=uncultured Porphyromonas sp. TaxID=159274 RepID=UPI00261A74A5|nr:hypothetical protein [uncultured Porphyromonas sp.]